MAIRRDVVVITGASAGVGRALARRFARDGARIGLIARNRVALEAAAREVEQLGGEALVLPLDVADAAAVERAAATVESRLGPIDVWINNAMVSVFSPVHQMQPEEYRRVLEVTFLGTVYGTMSALKRMRARDRGTIVLVGSALAYRGIPLQSSYCSAKHAIQGFADSLRTELLHDRSGVRLTMCQLPGVNTTQFTWVKSRLPRTPRPLGKVFQPELIADAIHWSAYHPKRERLIAWPTVKAVVGNALVPAYADKVLAREGIDGQQTDQPVSPRRRDNLWSPVPGTHDARGPFSAEAHTRSAEWWIERHRTALGLGALAGAGLGGVWWAWRRRASRPSPATAARHRVTR